MRDSTPSARPSPPRPLVRAPSSARFTWRIHAATPAAWGEALHATGGGVFHSPAGLAAASPAGHAVHAVLAGDDGRPIGIAVGVASRCRFALRARHYHFPSLPALAAGLDPEEALAGLVAELRGRGAADVVFDSFDAAWLPSRHEPHGSPGRPRLEYRVPLEPDLDAVAARFSTTHRRHLRRGEREAWSLRTLEGELAAQLLYAVQSEAARRAEQRGDGFLPQRAGSAATQPADLAAPWGTATFAAFRGDGPLAAALVGWAAGRAFYIAGGSTPEGYRAGAAVWLHWRIMAELAGRGVTSYNLGGTPATAADPSDPAHGLYRFKTGFAPEIIRLAGLRYTLRPGHARLHRLARWPANAFRGA